MYPAFCLYILENDAHLMHTSCTCTERQGRAHRAHRNAHALHSLHSCCWLTPHVLRARCAFPTCTLHTGRTLTEHTLHVGCAPTAFILMFTRCADTECTFCRLQMHLHCTYTVSYVCKLVVLHTHCMYTAHTMPSRFAHTEHGLLITYHPPAACALHTPSSRCRLTAYCMQAHHSCPTQAKHIPISFQDFTVRNKGSEMSRGTVLS